MTTNTLSASARRAIRKAAGANSHDSIRIEVVPGNSAPTIVGARYWKTNFTRRYPSGKCFSRTLYTPSTRRVQVGAEWAA